MAKLREGSKADSTKSQNNETAVEAEGGAVRSQQSKEQAKRPIDKKSVTESAAHQRTKAKEKLLPFASNLDYLECAMAWMEARARRLSLQQDLEKLLSPQEHRGYWPSDENAEQARRRLPKLRRQERELQRLYERRLSQHRKQGFLLAIDALSQEFALDEFERGVLLLSAGFCLSRRLASVFASIDEGHDSTPETFFNFNELSLSERIAARHYFSPRSRLLANDLIKMEFPHRYLDASDLFSVSLRITRRTFNFLLGDEALDDEFQEFSSIEKPRASFEQVVLDKGDKERILSVVAHHDRYLEARSKWGLDDVIQYGRGLVMLFFGKPGTGKTMTAHAIAKQIGKTILNVDIPTFVEHGDADRFLPSLFREARLQNAVLFFDECEQLFADRMYGNSLMTMLLTELERFEGVAILATNAPQVLDAALDRRILVKVRFPEPDRDARREIWAKHLPPTVPVAADLDLESLADRYELAGGYIKNAVLMAVAEAVHRQSKVITQEHLENAARQQLARPTEENKLAHPKVRLNQVVLAPALEVQVRELIDAARGRRTVLERWGIGAHLNYGKGLTALFHGPPGTGKTLCAEAVAGELNRPLLRASVPALLSKWVGETENRLEALFHEAKAHAAVLLLDEIDSLLFSRASSSHRWEMSTVNALLTLIEQFSGVLVMATNMPQSLDDALARRVTYRLAFALPDAAARERIWRTLLPASVPIDGELQLGALARAFELSGGEIKNAVFKAAFRASRSGALSQSLLWSAAEDEHNAGEKRRPSIGFAAMPQNERR